MIKKLEWGEADVEPWEAVYDQKPRVMITIHLL